MSDLTESKYTPVTVKQNSITALAFKSIAEKMVERVKFRNEHQETTKKVEIMRPLVDWLISVLVQLFGCLISPQPPEGG